MLESLGSQVLGGGSVSEDEECLAICEATRSRGPAALVKVRSACGRLAGESAPIEIAKCHFVVEPNRSANWRRLFSRSSILRCWIETNVSIGLEH